MHDADDVIIAAQTEHDLDGSIISGRSRFPHHSVAQGMRRQK
jgi:hypothetical protein